MTTYRDALAEIETLRQEAKEADRKLAISEAACASAMAEVEALREDLAKARDATGAAELALAVLRGEAKTRNEDGGLVSALHDVQREHDRLLRTAAQHAVDVYRQGNVMATVVAVARLGEVLDGGT